MIDVRQDTLTTLGAAFKPREALSVWRWAEKNIELPAGTTPRPGRYQTSWCPYVREPQEAYTDRTVKTIVLCFATRSAKTEIFLNCLRYSVAEERQACLWGKPNQEDADKDAEGRFRPSVESSDVLRALKPTNPHYYRKSLMRFRTAPVYFVGAGSPAKTRNVQAGRLFLDEIDVMKRASDRETGALENFLERVKDTPFPKILLSSTPTVASAQIWKEFIKGDQRYYYMPCWFCERPLKFTMSGLRWADEARLPDGTWDLAVVKETVHFLCPLCKKQILDKHKLPMLTAGHWVPTPLAERLTWENKIVPVEQGRRSYHLNSLYPEWLHFYVFAEKWILSKPDPEAWQSFINQWVAEPYFNFGNTDEMQEALKKATITTSMPAAKKIPDGYKPIMHVDVQQLEFWYRVRAFNADRESIGLEFGMAISFEDLEIIRKKWGVPLAGMDIGYAARLQDVLVWIKTHELNWIATRGAGNMFAPIRMAQVHIGGGVLKGMPVRCIMVNATEWKEILTTRIKEGPPRWQNERGISEIYKKQMSGEVRKQRRLTNGAWRVEYVKIGPNHAFDCEYNLQAMFDVIGGVLFGFPPAMVQPAAPPEMPAQVPTINPDYDQERDRDEAERDRDSEQLQD